MQRRRKSYELHVLLATLVMEASFGKFSKCGQMLQVTII
jgi:hypothetical protein